MGARGSIVGVKRTDRDADHSTSSTDEVMNAWSYASTPPYVIIAWGLHKHRDFTFTLRHFCIKRLILNYIMALKALLNCKK
jgi:hypothetical protein